MIVFNSIEYILFLLIVVIAYWFLPRIWQNVLLLVSSYFFYATWDWRYLGIIFFLTLSNYYVGNLIYTSSDQRNKKWYAIFIIGINILNLGFFKYYNFFLDSLDVLLGSFQMSVTGLHLDIIIPIGISFFTFQKIAYIYDIYTNKTQPADSLLSFALFSCFFPQLIAGPIERPGHLLPQIQNRRLWDVNNVLQGCDFIIWGMLKKVFIADNVAYYVNIIFSLNQPSTLLILVATFAFGIQIYADFSGYSDIARGSAKLLGIDLVRNFNHPYLSQTPQEFWRRWHISFSSWLRDYIYIPLGGSRCSKPRHIFNLFVTWFLCGLWHGAAWNFVVWGLYNGLMVTLSSLRQKKHPARKMPSISVVIFSIIVTYLVMNFGWLFFRVGNLSDIVEFFPLPALLRSLGDIPIAVVIIVIMIFYSLPLLLADVRKYLLTDVFLKKYLKKPFGVFERFQPVLPYRRGICYSILIVVIILFGASGKADFIYFQF